MQPDPKAANKLEQLASVPLTDWQSPAVKTASLAIHTADATSRDGADVGSSAMNKGSPTFSWGPHMTPPQPVNLKINVFADSHGSSQAELHGSKGDKLNHEGRRGSSSYEGPLLKAVEHLHNSTASATAGGPSKHHPGRTQTDAATALDQQPVPASEAAPDEQSRVTLPVPELSASEAAHNQHSSASLPAPSGLSGMHSSGADELAAAVSGVAGSPWDPKQGPKLLESLSDFSSFNSSLNMLQQLAGKLNLYVAVC